MVAWGVLKRNLHKVGCCSGSGATSSSPFLSVFLVFGVVGYCCNQHIARTYEEKLWIRWRPLVCRRINKTSQHQKRNQFALKTNSFRSLGDTLHIANCAIIVVMWMKLLVVVSVLLLSVGWWFPPDELLQYHIKHARIDTTYICMYVCMVCVCFLEAVTEGHINIKIRLHN